MARDTRPVMTLDLYPPRILRRGQQPPHALRKITLAQLCSIAGIRIRVTSNLIPTICLHAGKEHYRPIGYPKMYYVGGCQKERVRKREAFRILEVLAFGFQDYAARETICGRNLYRIPDLSRITKRHLQSARFCVDCLPLLEMVLEYKRRVSKGKVT